MCTLAIPAVGVARPAHDIHPRISARAARAGHQQIAEAGGFVRRDGADARADVQFHFVPRADDHGRSGSRTAMLHAASRARRGSTTCERRARQGEHQRHYWAMPASTADDGRGRSGPRVAGAAGVRQLRRRTSSRPRRLDDRASHACGKGEPSTTRRHVPQGRRWRRGDPRWQCGIDGLRVVDAR